METHSVYCSACDRKVRVTFPNQPVAANTAGPELDPEGVCLDYCSSACTGSMCALFERPPTEMLEKLRDSPICAEGSDDQLQ